MTGELAAFVAARLDEDEAAARTWAERDMRPLREVAFKRSILARVLSGPAVEGGHRFDEGVSFAMADALLGIAAIWSDHPDYRQEWAQS